MLRALALSTLALALAGGCSRTIPVTVERIQVEHGPNMSVTMQSDADLETSVSPDVQAFVDTALPDDLNALSDADVQAVAQGFIDGYRAAFQPRPHASGGAEPTAYASSVVVVERAHALLAERNRLTALQAEQLDRILGQATSNR
ncbi:MAG: hypothetical protein AAGF99_07495 [Bacteroidota bacterium]